MTSGSGAAYGVPCAARALASVPNKEEKIRFIVGTLNLREENELHLLEYDQETDSVRCEAVYAHQHEVWDLAPCPYDPSLLFTVYNTPDAFKVSLWRMPPGASSGSRAPLAHGAELAGLTGSVRRVLWSPGSARSAADSAVVTVEDGTLRLWKPDRGGVSCVGRGAAPAGETLAGGAWDPHDSAAAATVAGGAVAVWDLRSMAVCARLCGGVPIGVAPTAVDYNPQRAHVVAAACDDGRLRLWDARSPARPLLELVGGHKHWAVAVAYNPFHDSMLLSASTDHSVALWRVMTLAADAGGGGGGGDDAPAKGPQASPGRAKDRGGDGLVQSYSAHEDAVYGLCWSSVDPWAFASLSYDGRVFVSHVPRSEKYAILI